MPDHGKPEQSEIIAVKSKKKHLIACSAVGGIMGVFAAMAFRNMGAITDVGRNGVHGNLRDQPPGDRVADVPPTAVFATGAVNLAFVSPLFNSVMRNAGITPSELLELDALLPSLDRTSVVVVLRQKLKEMGLESEMQETALWSLIASWVTNVCPPGEVESSLRFLTENDRTLAVSRALGAAAPKYCLELHMKGQGRCGIAGGIACLTDPGLVKDFLRMGKSTAQEIWDDIALEAAAFPVDRFLLVAAALAEEGVDFRMNPNADWSRMGEELARQGKSGLDALGGRGHPLIPRQLAAAALASELQKGGLPLAEFQSVKIGEMSALQFLLETNCDAATRRRLGEFLAGSIETAVEIASGSPQMRTVLGEMIGGAAFSEVLTNPAVLAAPGNALRYRFRVGLPRAG